MPKYNASLYKLCKNARFPTPLIKKTSVRENVQIGVIYTDFCSIFCKPFRPWKIRHSAKICSRSLITIGCEMKKY